PRTRWGADPEAGDDGPDRRATRRPDANRRILAGRGEEPAIPRVLHRADLGRVATLDHQIDRPWRRSAWSVARYGLGSRRGHPDGKYNEGSHHRPAPRHAGLR